MTPAARVQAAIELLDAIISMRNVVPKEGLPISVNINNDEIKFRYPGQIRDLAVRAKI